MQELVWNVYHYSHTTKHIEVWNIFHSIKFSERIERLIKKKIEKETFAEKVKTLSSAERRILNYYIEGYDTADIPDLAFISIHTVKKHNRSIYQKLGVASRDELMLYIELFRCCGRLEELTCSPVETE